MSAMASRYPGYLSQFGPDHRSFKNWEGGNENPFFGADESYVRNLKNNRASCANRVIPSALKSAWLAENVPVGWG